jgi:hypothetical protein
MANGDVPASIDRLLRATLRKDRAERPASAADLALRLRRAYDSFLFGEDGVVGSPEEEAARPDEDEPSLDNMPTLAPIPEKLRRTPSLAASAVEPAAEASPGESGELEPTEPVEIPPPAPSSKAERRALVVRAGVVAGSAVALVLAFLTFAATSESPSSTPAPVTQPVASPPPGETVPPDPPVEGPPEDGRPPKAVRSANPGNATSPNTSDSSDLDSDGRSVGVRASDASAKATNSNARESAQDDAEQPKKKPAAQPAKDEKKERKKAWYDPRRWFGKN